ncbi:cyclin b3;1 isoform X2 [Tasmannia lanceolata]|uniref:cyclin b3;1 isoform X2 n=1 Tax=Tasmannia lanceolata TaxID=3420 RepID=UPI0040630CC2
MVSKGKTKAKDPLPEDRRPFKNDFKFYTDNEKIKIPARKSLDVDGRMIARKSLIPTQKSVPSNVIMKTENKENVEKATGKCDISVKTKTGRKALADVSNVGSYILRSRLNDGAKLTKFNSEKSNLLHGKTRNGNIYGQRVQVGKSVLVGNASSRKPFEIKLEPHDQQMVKACHTSNSVGAREVKICSDVVKINGQFRRSIGANDGKVSSKPVASTWKSAASQRIYRGFSSIESRNEMTKGTEHKLGSIKTNVKHSEKITNRSSISVGIRTRRKALVAINTVQNSQLRNRPSDGSKMIRNKIEKRNLPPGKTQGGRLISRLRLSIPDQKVTDVSTSSRKPVVTARRIELTGSKTKMTSKAKPTLGLKKKFASTTQHSCMNKEGKVAIRPIQKDIEPKVSNDCSLDKASSIDHCCSSGSVTAIISRPKSSRRRSYTSSLMARSKVIGECTDISKKGELPNIDDASNPLEVAEYVDDIYQYYWVLEAQNPSLANYMSIQTEINPRMRGILINWLVEVHLKFELMQETLFLMVELFDRFIAMITIKKDEIQLVGLTTLLLASKYEDFWHPKIKDLLSISVNVYTRDEMLAMEKLILKKLMFRLNAPTPYVFMLRFLKAAQSDTKLEHLAFYLIELCLVEYEALKFKPSLLCASAIYVARCTLNMVPPWTELLKKHTHYEAPQLRASADMILRFQGAANRGQLKVTYEKFLSSERSCVAEIQAIKKLPL